VFPLRWLAVCPALFAATISVAQTAPVPAPVSVIIVGDFHMDNPDRDLHDMKADDVLLPKRQAEIQAITQSLAGFRPTKVMAEAPGHTAAEPRRSGAAWISAGADGGIEARVWDRCRRRVPL